MTAIIRVVGMGLSGADSLSPSALALVESATLLIGGQRHLQSFQYLQAAKSDDKPNDKPNDKPGAKAVEAWPLGNFTQTFAQLRSHLKIHPDTRAVVLASGDPLFFGIGRLLLEAFPAEQLTFYPQISSIQLAFSRLKLPWQDATLVSVHGRDEQRLIQAVKRGDDKIAVLTDGMLTPGAIATLITALNFPVHYRLWICENLGSKDERVSSYLPEQLSQQPFAPLNVVVLVRQSEDFQPQLSSNLPLIGLPDSVFKGFRDRPTLITKREIRLLVLGELAPLDGQIIWDIGAGTGSVSIELSRLCPNAHVYAIEKTAIGATLIRQNAERLAIAPITPIQGKAPAALANLPWPNKVFIGGSSGALVPILDFLQAPPAGDHRRLDRVVLAIATIEHLAQITAWVKQSEVAAQWHYQLTQISVSRSLPVGPLTRFLPLNPITLVTLTATG